MNYMEKKYKLTDETIEVNGKTLYRIEALKDFSNVKKGDKGGFIEKEENLSHLGDAWVYDDAAVCDMAQIYDYAKIFERATIYNKAIICGYSTIGDHVIICDNAIIKDVKIFGEAIISHDAKILSNKDFIVFKNWWSSGRYFTWTRSNNMWTVGCFYGTGEELIEKAYEDSKLSGDEYKRIVEYVNSINHNE